MKLIASALACSAAMTRSPWSSSVAESTTIASPPRPIAEIACSMPPARSRSSTADLPEVVKGPPEVDQRAMLLPHDAVDDIADQDRVVAALDPLVDLAVEEGDRFLQDRHPALAVAERGGGELVGSPARECQGDPVMMIGEDVYAEPLRAVERGEAFGRTGQADEDLRRLRRDRGEGGRREPSRGALAVHRRDYRHAAGERGQRVAEAFGQRSAIF